MEVRIETFSSPDLVRDDMKEAARGVFSRQTREEFETMEVLSGLTDDQMALLMCIGALFGCGAIMSLSYYIGGDRREDQEIHILRNDQDHAEETSRKAA